MKSMFTTTAELLDRMRLGSKWMDLLVPGLEISDIGILIIGVDLGGPFSTERSCRIRVYQGCCKTEVSYSKAGLVSRLRRGGEKCRSCRCKEVGQRSSRAAQRRRDERNADLRRARLSKQMSDVDRAFSLMNAAMPLKARHC